MADKVNFSSELSKYKLSKSVLKVMTGDALAERLFHLKPKPITISDLLYKLHSFNNSLNLLF